MLAGLPGFALLLLGGCGVSFPAGGPLPGATGNQLVVVTLPALDGYDIADKGINECVNKECWPEIVDGFTSTVSAGRITDAFFYAIGECTRCMSRHYPFSDEVVNILPGHLIEI